MSTVEVPYKDITEQSWHAKKPYPMPLAYDATLDTYTFNQDVYDAWLESIGQKMPKPIEVIETRPGQCECGSTAAGSARHSQWCPAFEK